MKNYDWYMNYQKRLTEHTRDYISNKLQSYPSLPIHSREDRDRLIGDMIKTGHILLLPGTVYAFALRNRRWGLLITLRKLGFLLTILIVALNLSNLQDIPKEEGWDDLILPSGHRSMVRAVVENHTAGSRSTAGITKAATQVDIVRGKGMRNRREHQQHPFTDLH